MFGWNFFFVFRSCIECLFRKCRFKRGMLKVSGLDVIFSCVNALSTRFCSGKIHKLAGKFWPWVFCPVKAYLDFFVSLLMTPYSFLVRQYNNVEECFFYRRNYILTFIIQGSCNLFIYMLLFPIRKFTIDCYLVINRAA